MKIFIHITGLYWKIYLLFSGITIVTSYMFEPVRVLKYETTQKGVDFTLLYLKGIMLKGSLISYCAPKPNDDVCTMMSPIDENILKSALSTGKTLKCPFPLVVTKEVHKEESISFYGLYIKDDENELVEEEKIYKTKKHKPESQPSGSRINNEETMHDKQDWETSKTMSNYDTPITNQRIRSKVLRRVFSSILQNTKTLLNGTNKINREMNDKVVQHDLVPSVETNDMVKDETDEKDSVIAVEITDMIKKETGKKDSVPLPKADTMQIDEPLNKDLEDTPNKPEHVTTIPFCGTKRVVKGRNISFFELYKSFDDDRGNIFYYHYTLSGITLLRYGKDLPGIISYIKGEGHKIYMQDICYGKKLEEVFNPQHQNIIYNQLASIITNEDAKQTLKVYVQKFKYAQGVETEIGYQYLSLAHLVPMMHLQFEGAQRMHGNCSVVAVWKEVYDCLLEVDEEIFRIPVDVERTVEVTTGIFDVLRTPDDREFQLNDSELIVPGVIWKRVITHLRLNNEEKFHSFSVFITNNPFQNKDETLSPFMKVNQRWLNKCNHAASIHIKQEHREIVHVCEFSEKDWEDLLNELSIISVSKIYDKLKKWVLKEN